MERFRDHECDLGVKRKILNTDTTLIPRPRDDMENRGTMYLKHVCNKQAQVGELSLNNGTWWPSGSARLTCLIYRSVTNVCAGCGFNPSSWD
jgi:hypothetical protein